MIFSDMTAPAKDFNVKMNSIKRVRDNINWSLDNATLILKNNQDIGNSFSAEKTTVKNGPIIPIPTKSNKDVKINRRIKLGNFLLSSPSKYITF